MGFLHCILRLLALLLVAMAGAAQARDAPKLLLDRKLEDSPTLLLLGTAHLANPGRDLINIEIEDVLSGKRQAQIAKVIDELAAFRPTHIAIEWPLTKQEKLDTLYQDYRAGRYTLSRSERDQFALRLAAKLNLPRVHAVDWNEMPPGDLKNYDWPAWAEANGQKALLTALTNPRLAVAGPLRPDDTIGAWLLRMNSSPMLLQSHRIYFDIASVGDIEAQPGAAWVGTWYARNLRIFGNLTRLTANAQDRILVVYGYGHAHLLRQLARESGAFRLVDVDQVLKGR